MQIHELNTLNASMDGNAYVAVDNGTDTGKVSVPNLTKNVEEQIEQVNARVDNIIAGGTAPSEAEIVDARLGENGETYASLGAAIRGQISELLTFNDASYDVTNLTFEQGAIDGGTNTYNSTKYVRSDSAIKVSAGDLLVFNTQPRQYILVVYYYSKSSYSSYVNQYTSWTINTNTSSILKIERDGYIRIRVTTGLNVDITASEINALNIVDLYASEIIKIQNELSDQENLINSELMEIITPTFEQGAISAGVDSASSIYCRTPNYTFMPKGSKLIVGGLDFQIVANLYLYFSDSYRDYGYSYGGEIVGNVSQFAIVTIPEDSYIRIRIRRGNNTAITPETVESWDAVKYVKNSIEISETDVKTKSFNSSFLTESVNWITPLTDFSALFNDSDYADSFLFFTDPHIMGSYGTLPDLLIQKYIGYMQKVYNSTPCSFIVCGGDWLNDHDTTAQAKEKLGYIDGFMTSIFGDEYKPIVGNHDTNYIGSSELDYKTIRNLCFRREGQNYYSFKTKNARYCVLDTWHENQTTMNAYRWEQIDWLANLLLENDDARNIIMFHIYYTGGVGTVTATFADVIGQIIEAYNNHTSVETYGRTYDFTGTTGKIYCSVVGHSHEDFTDTLGGVPCIGTVNMQSGGVPSFDLVYVDFSNGKYNTIRIGTGSNRSINI